ncbi:MAG TPA: DUF4130 domain-containing protein [Methanothrix sp.]|nr:DUF4130 domain-containing protein [Methanothrix sp.]
MKVPENFSFYLSMNRECSERLMHRAQQIGAAELDVSLEREDIRMRKMVHEVMGEVHRMKAFVRLSSLKSRVLFGFLKPRHGIGEHICDHFARRNAGMIVVLGNGNESWISLFQNGIFWRDRGSGLNESLDRLRSALQDDSHSNCCSDSNGFGSQEYADARIYETDDDDKSSQNAIMHEINAECLWQTYYDSQYCIERKNKTTFRSRMPRRDQEAAGLRLVQNKKNATLDEFLK